MEKKRKHKPDPVLRRMGILRMVLCVIAAVCCAGIVVSAINLAAPPRKSDIPQSNNEDGKTLESIETDPTTPSSYGTDDQAAEPGDVSDVPTETENLDGGTSKTGEQEGSNPSVNDGVEKKEDENKVLNNQPKKGSDGANGYGGTTLDSGATTGSSTTEPPTTEAPTTEDQTTEDQTTEDQTTEDQTTETSTTVKQGENLEPAKAPGWALPLLIGSISGLLLDLGGIVLCSRSIAARKKELQSQHRREKVEKAYTHIIAEDTGTTQIQTPQEQAVPGGMTVGSLQNIGGRPYQEDSSGIASLRDGALAVVADGMGGLADGDKVSQKIVMTMMGYSKSLRPGQMDDVLPKMVQSAAAEINKMLGPDGLYKSGSTLMTVLVRQNRFHWAAVGDSHIYLYRDGQLIQLNQEHNRGQELLYQAIAGEKTFDEVRADPKKSGLTSFVGMGELKYMEKSLHSIALKAGDRILLMTDGVFNALSDQEIAMVLSQNPDVKAAAQMMERGVLAKAAPHQDNFTAVILGF